MSRTACIAVSYVPCGRVPDCRAPPAGVYVSPAGVYAAAQGRRFGDVGTDSDGPHRVELGAMLLRDLLTTSVAPQDRVPREPTGLREEPVDPGLP